MVAKIATGEIEEKAGETGKERPERVASRVVVVAQKR
jgi:hypothetical protein